MDVGTDWLAALAVRSVAEQPRPAEEVLALAVILAGRLAAEHEAGSRHGADLPPVLLAPEVLAGGPPSVAADIYALAAGVWALLAGRPPHVLPGERDVPAELLLRRRRSAPADALDLPAPLVSLLRRALSPDPAHRPADAAGLQRALQERADLVTYARRRKWADRNRPRPVVDRSGAPTAWLPSSRVPPISPDRP